MFPPAIWCARRPIRLIGLMMETASQNPSSKAITTAPITSHTSIRCAESASAVASSWSCAAVSRFVWTTSAPISTTG